MSMYTTGELARLCGVSVRTVQYYDTRKILIPSQLSEGGRRLYSENDLQKMKIICFLRELDISINNIGELFAEEHPENVISVLLEEQEKSLKKELEDKRNRIAKLSELKRGLRQVEQFSLEAIGDIAHIMSNKKKLRKVRCILISVGIVVELIEVLTLIYWIVTGVWQPFAIGMGVNLVLGIGISRYYFREVSYICPQCHSVFKPRWKEALFAAHTFTTRKLTCTCCGHHGFCIETYGGTDNETEN